MAETKGKAAPSKKSTTDPDHPHKVALDAYGGDPLDPNDAMLERIAAAVKSGKKDDMVDRWAVALQTIMEEGHADKPKRVFLSKLAAAVLDGEKDDDIKAWASGEAKPPKRSVHNISHLQG